MSNFFENATCQPENFLSAADAGQRRHIIALGLIAAASATVGMPFRRLNSERLVSSAELFRPVLMILIDVVASVGMLATEEERF